MLDMKIKITWPLLIVLLIVLLAYLTRDPGRRSATPTRPSRPPRRTRPIIIDQAGPARDYETETERLDREAADAGRRAYDDHQRQFDAFKERMNARNDKRRERFNTRR
jgi:hypothetical protein